MAAARRDRLDGRNSRSVPQFVACTGTKKLRKAGESSLLPRERLLPRFSARSQCDAGKPTHGQSKRWSRPPLRVFSDCNRGLSQSIYPLGRLLAQANQLSETIGVKASGIFPRAIAILVGSLQRHRVENSGRTLGNVFTRPDARRAIIHADRSQWAALCVRSAEFRTRYDGRGFRCLRCSNVRFLSCNFFHKEDWERELGKTQPAAEMTP